MAKTTLDEWIYFFKTEEIKDEFKAKGIKQAKVELDILKLSETERKEYEKYIEQERYEESLIVSNYKVGELKGIEEERKRQEEKRRNEKNEIAKKSLKEGLSIDVISKITGLSKEEIENLK